MYSNHLSRNTTAEMPRRRENQSRITILDRGINYGNLPQRAPLPNLMALHRSGELYSRPHLDVERATVEDVMATYEPTEENEDAVRAFVGMNAPMY